jgi:hypothetical protein
MRPDQTVAEMAEEVLWRQAKAMVSHTREPFESALEAVASTEAGQQLRELANGEHRHKKAQDQQARSMLRERIEGHLMQLGIASERHYYSWVENYTEWLKGKEERPEYHALLEEELETLSIETRRVGTSTASGTRRSLCPLCGRGSSLLVHSRYSRTGSELPWRATPGYTF